MCADDPPGSCKTALSLRDMGTKKTEETVTDYRMKINSRKPFTFFINDRF